MKRDCLFLFCVIRDHDKLKSVNVNDMLVVTRETINLFFVNRETIT